MAKMMPADLSGFMCALAGRMVQHSGASQRLRSRAKAALKSKFERESRRPFNKLSRKEKVGLTLGNI